MSSLRLAQKRSLSAANEGAIGDASEGVAAPTAAKRARRTGPTKPKTQQPGAARARVPAGNMPRIELEEDREEDEDYNEDEDGLSDQDADGDEDEEQQDEAEDVSAMKPAKKRFAAAAASTPAADVAYKPGRKLPAASASTAPAAAALARSSSAASTAAAGGEDDDSDIPDFDDGYASDLMGDDEDRERLAAMGEIDREQVLAQRFEARRSGQQVVEMKRAIRAQKKAQGGTAAGRGARAAARTASASSAAAAPSATAAAVPQEPTAAQLAAKQAAEAAEAAARRAREAEEDDESSSSSSFDSGGSSDSDDSGSSSDSSSSASSSASSDSDEGGAGGRRKRLRRRAATTSARGRKRGGRAGRGGDSDEDGEGSSGASSSDDEEISSAVRRRGTGTGTRGRKGRKRAGHSDDEDEDDAEEDAELEAKLRANKAKGKGPASKKQKDAERNYRLYGSDSEGDDEEAEGGESSRGAGRKGRGGRSSSGGGEPSVSVKAIKGAHAASYRRSAGEAANIDMYLSDSDEGGVDFDDTDAPMGGAGASSASASASASDAATAALYGSNEGGAASSSPSSSSSSLPDASEVPYDIACAQWLMPRCSILFTLDKPAFGDLLKGSLVRVLQPHDPAEVAKAKAAGREIKPAYRLATVVEHYHSGKLYDPWGGPPAPPDARNKNMAVAAKKGLKLDGKPVERTDVWIHVAFGSSRTTASGERRGVPINHISNDRPDPAEWEVYKKRLAAQYESTGDPDDRLPTIGEIKRMKAAKLEAARSRAYTAEDVTKSIRIHDVVFNEAKLRAVPNLAYLRDNMQVRLEVCSRKVVEFKDDDPEKRALTKEIATLKARLAAVAAEEVRRKERQRAAEAEKLASQRNLSTLTSRMNARAAEANLRTMEEMSAALRAKTEEEGAAGFTAAMADTDADPFARRRVMPQIMWAVPGQKIDGGEEGKGKEDKGKKKAPAATSSVSGLAAGRHMEDEEDAVVAPVSFDDIFLEAPTGTSVTGSQAAAAAAGATSAAASGTPSTGSGSAQAGGASASAPGKKVFSLADMRARLAASGSSNGNGGSS